MTQRSRRPQERIGHRAPSECPVCGDQLAVIRLGCTSCGTELAGVFRSCEFCALNEKETEMLRVFLSSRGNLREVEKYLGVSYPTARLRFAELLEKLGLGEAAEAEATLTRDQILSEVASGALTPAEAQELIGRLQ